MRETLLAWLHMVEDGKLLQRVIYWSSLNALSTSHAVANCTDASFEGCRGNEALRNDIRLSHLVLQPLTSLFISQHLAAPKEETLLTESAVLLKCIRDGQRASPDCATWQHGSEWEDSLEDSVGQAPGETEPVVDGIVGLEVPGGQDGGVSGVLQHDGQPSDGVTVGILAHPNHGDVGCADSRGHLEGDERQG